MVTNLSSKKLGNCEIDLHNKGLDFGILPGKFCKYEQILKSFTRNVVRFFNNNTELNLRVFWSISTANSNLVFFYKKKEDEMVLTRKEKETLRTRSQDTSIIICKPDKGNGAVV